MLVIVLALYFVVWNQCLLMEKILRTVFVAGNHLLGNGDEEQS